MVVSVDRAQLFPFFHVAFSLSPPFSLCPFVISLSLVLACPLTLSSPLLPFISHHAYILSLSLSHSLHLSPLGRSLSEAPRSIQASSKSQALTNPFVFLFLLPVHSAFRDTVLSAEGVRGINRKYMKCAERAEFQHSVCSWSRSV